MLHKTHLAGEEKTFSLNQKIDFFLRRIFLPCAFSCDNFHSNFSLNIHLNAFTSAFTFPKKINLAEAYP